MTPMSELAKCRCGAEARLAVTSYDGDVIHARVVCTSAGCDARGPLQPTKADAGERWDDLMRPRPVAEWSDDELCAGDATLGYVYYDAEDQVWVGVCLVTGASERRGSDGEARAWLADRVRAAGFEVREPPTIPPPRE